MAWTYDATDLDKTTDSGRLNIVRLLTGDTDTSDQQVQDEEITFALLETNNSVYYAAGWIARAISGKYARMVTIDLDDQLMAEYSDRAGQYALLADRLEYQGKRTAASLGMSGGGITCTSVQSAWSDPERIPASFRRDQFSNPSDTSYYEE